LFLPNFIHSILILFPRQATTKEKNPNIIFPHQHKRAVLFVLCLPSDSIYSALCFGFHLESILLANYSKCIPPIRNTSPVDRVALLFQL